MPPVVLGKHVVGKDFDDGALGVAEDDGLGNARRNPAGAFAFHAMSGQLLCDRSQIAAGSNLQ